MNGQGLDLRTWRDFFRYHPYHFFGLSNSLVPVRSECQTLVTQYGYQGADLASRDEVERLIAEAERDFARYAQYWPYPAYVSEVVHVSPDRPRLLRLSYGMVLALGQPVETAAGSVTLTYSDQNGDGVTDTATATAINLPAGTTIDQLVWKTQAGDGRRIKEIRPIETVLSGDPLQAAVTFDVTTLVKTGLEDRIVAPFSGWDPNITPPTAGTPYPEELDVFTRVTTDDDDHPAGMGLWTPSYCCGGDLTPTRVNLRLVDADLGYAEITDCQWAFPDCRLWPRQVRVYYQAGVPYTDDGQYDPAMADIIAKFSGARLARKICACDRANAVLTHWQEDWAQTSGRAEIFAVPDVALRNPFGSRRGEVAAWTYLADNPRISRGVGV